MSKTTVIIRGYNMIPIRTETSMNAGPGKEIPQLKWAPNVSESQARRIFIIVAAKQNSAQGKREKGRKGLITL